MKIRPTALKDEFEELFRQQQEIENSEEFQNKRRKYNDINLEIKHDLNTLSEIFQDPDLLSKISKDSHSLMQTTLARPPRVRAEQDLIVSKKPQAKDVNINRKIDDGLEDIYSILENMINKESEYINPLAPKRRKYLGNPEQSTSTRQSSVDVISTENSSVQNDDPNDMQISLSRSYSNDELSILQTPASSSFEYSEPMEIGSTNIPSTQLDENEKDELELMFEEASKLIRQSPLQTVGSKHLYNCLPRQADPNAFHYVKEDYIPTEKTKEGLASALDDTLITVLIFNPTNPNLKFQQIEILGSQTVSAIRDAIYCQEDFSHHRDHKDSEPDGEILNTSEKKTSPSFIYMNHTFYVDTRYHDYDLKYYDNLIEPWMAKKGVNREKFHYATEHMHQSYLDTIQLELHRPFAFIHQNICEHVLMIKDVRLISPNEYKSKEEFPRTTHNLRYDRLKCSMCTIYPATKITTDDVISGLSPCYFCDVCFESFHPDPSDVQYTEYNGTPGGKVKLGKFYKSKKIQ